MVWRADEKPQVHVVEVDLDRVEEVRQQLPLLSARRTDVYTVEQKQP